MGRDGVHSGRLIMYQSRHGFGNYGQPFYKSVDNGRLSHFCARAAGLIGHGVANGFNPGRRCR